MTLKQLIQNTSWPEISSLFLEIYPDAEENIKGYEKVFEKLRLIEPEQIDMSIVITTENDVYDGEEYIEVCGLYNNPKNDEEHYSQGIEITPWRQWLGMDISKESLASFTPQEVIVHCIYEMTFVGFSEEDIQKKMDSIEQSKKDFLELPEEELFASAASIEELLKDWEEEED